MADADRIAAALRYQQEMDAAQRPATMNPNIAAQGATGRALVAPPTSVMDERYPAWKKSQDDAENLINAADMIGAAIPLAGPAVKGAVALGRYAGPELARGLEQHMVRMGGIMPLDVYHGTPHRFPPTAKNPLGEFDPMKIGTGEGAQAYGHGLYLAENPKVASEYAEKLTNPEVLFGGKKLNEISDPMTAKTAKWISDNVSVMQTDARAAEAKRLFSMLPMEQQKTLGIPEINTTGNLYKVDLPDEHIAKMLDWDKPLSQQHPDVQAALSKTKNKQLRAMVDYASSPYSTPGLEGEVKTMGEAIKLLGMNANPAKGSQLLAKEGIPGIKYLDQGSRGASTGTRNFVVFPGNEGLLNILGRE